MVSEAHLRAERLQDDDDRKRAEEVAKVDIILTSEVVAEDREQQARQQAKVEDPRQRQAQPAVWLCTYADVDELIARRPARTWVQSGGQRDVREPPPQTGRSP